MSDNSAAGQKGDDGLTNAQVEKALGSTGVSVAVVPLKSCPHIDQIGKLPDQALDVSVPCSVCGDKSENWICLKCYSVNCARFVNGHGVKHFEENNGHSLALSFSDISVWCYECENYIHNEVFTQAKEALLKSKFGPSVDETKKTET